MREKMMSVRACVSWRGRVHNLARSVDENYIKTFRTVTLRNRQRFAPPTAAPSYLPTSRRRRAGGGAELPTYFPLLTEGSYLARKKKRR